MRQGKGETVCRSNGADSVDEVEWKAKECEKEVNNGVGTVGMKNEGDA